MIEKIKGFFEIFYKKQSTDKLTPHLAEQFTTTMNDAISEAGKAGFKEFIESYDETEEAIDYKGKTLRRKISSEKRFMSPFGEVNIKRGLYQADRGGKCYAPLDTKWGMENEFATPEVRDATLYGSALMSPCEFATMLQKCSFFNPSTTAIQNIVNKAGSFIEEKHEDLSADIFSQEKAPEGTKVLTASLDGANVLLNEAGKKAGRPIEKPAEEHKEAKLCYKNAMVGSITYYGSVPEGKNSPSRLQSHYTARMPENHYPTFRKQFEQELDHAEASIDQSVKKVVLADGHRSIWGYVDKNSRFDSYEKLIDFYHTTEHLSSAGEALFGKKSEEGTKWYRKWRKKLKEEDNAAEGVIKSIDYYKVIKKLTQSRIDDLEKERGFFKRNKHRMDYADFRRRGLPIGSGPVEGACKTIVKDRLCRSGMRWSREGGQHVLHLRSIVKSGRWDKFWLSYRNIMKEAA
jgi:hypothetical protein